MKLRHSLHRLIRAVTLLTAALLSAQTAPQHGKTSSALPSADTVWNSLVEGNRRFVAGKSSAPNVIDRRHSLAKRQNPHVAVLSCSDSRVPPEIIFDQSLGDLFVVRVAGNSADPLGIGSLEYAVEHLGTTLIVVLGHQSCGAVTAACSGEKMPTPDLEAVAQPITASCTVAKKQARPHNLVDFAIKEHVRSTSHDLLLRSSILKHAYDEGRLHIIDAYYSLDTGIVTRLP
jgi:carbonic anhydrase